MSSTAELFIALGGILLCGLAADYLGRHTFLPRVTLLIMLGMAIGPHVLDVIPESVIERFEFIANMTLLMIGFLLGGKLTGDTLKNTGGQLLWISLSAVFATVIVVTVGLKLIGVSLAMALMLGCIATATDPAATVDVIRELRLRNKFSDLLMSIVAVDDAWALAVFSIGLALTAVLMGVNGAAASIMLALWEIGGAVIVGLVIGLPAAYLTGRITPGEPMLIEALGTVFLCGGIALWLDLSYIIAAMVMGMTIVNLAKHHDYPFHAIEGIEWPFMIVFFVLAGASAEFTQLVNIGYIGAVYVVLRTIGKIVGAQIGGVVGKADTATKRWMGVALLPQAGVAIGMALVAANEFPEQRHVLLTVAIGSTVFFELTGPIATRYALRKAQQTQ